MIKHRNVTLSDQFNNTNGYFWFSSSLQRAKSHNKYKLCQTMGRKAWYCMKAAKCLTCDHMVSNTFNLFISEADLTEPVKSMHQYDCHCQPNSVKCAAKLPLVAFLCELYAVTVGGFTHRNCFCVSHNSSFQTWGKQSLKQHWGRHTKRLLFENSNLFVSICLLVIQSRVT